MTSRKSCKASSVLLGLAFGTTLFTACVTSPNEESSLDASLRLKGAPEESAPSDSSKVQGAGTVKVDICHLPPGNTENVQRITVGSPAYDAHMAHGDQACDEGDDDSSDDGNEGTADHGDTIDHETVDGEPVNPFS
jgi:hypothetical protein